MCSHRMFILSMTVCPRHNDQAGAWSHTLRVCRCYGVDGYALNKSSFGDGQFEKSMFSFDTWQFVRPFTIVRALRKLPTLKTLATVVSARSSVAEARTSTSSLTAEVRMSTAVSELVF